MFFLYLSIAFALVDWMAVAAKHRTIEYLAKPGTLIFLVAWFMSQMPADPTWLSLLILAGLVFSLAGDIFLMLPGSWFLAGLVAFLMAHLAYIGGFNADGFCFRWESIPFALAILLLAVPVYLRIRSGLIAGNNQQLVIPVTAYVIVISSMVFSAATTLCKDGWTATAGILVVVGAFLFFLSDSILAWNRFVRPIPKGGLFTIIPYHLAQYLIAAGTLAKLGS